MKILKSVAYANSAMFTKVLVLNETMKINFLFVYVYYLLGYFVNNAHSHITSTFIQECNMQVITFSVITLNFYTNLGIMLNTNIFLLYDLCNPNASVKIFNSPIKQFIK